MNKHYNVVVLGACGMLGRVVYKYLKREHPLNIFGTDRNNTEFIELDALSPDKCLKNLRKKLKKIDYIINCIGILNKDIDKNIKDAIAINSLFPNKLARWTEKSDCKIIHVSTDAVFSPVAGSVCEKDMPYPIDLYGSSKFLGEPNSSKVLTVRTSIIGFDPIKKKGLLEWVANNKNGTLKGYKNQKWSGCTVLQFAILCDDLIFNGKFDLLRKKTRIFHFAPISDITKYEMVKSMNNMFLGEKQVKKEDGQDITRILYSEFVNLLKIKRFESTFSQALKKLISFEHGKQEKTCIRSGHKA